jgi:hypothetical protein
VIGPDDRDEHIGDRVAQPGGPERQERREGGELRRTEIQDQDGDQDCDSGSWAGRRPSLGGYVTRMGTTDGATLPEAMVLKETRSNPQIPTPFPHRFPLNSHALTSVEGLLGQDEIDAAIQTTSTSKARRVDFGGCGPPQPYKSKGFEKILRSP